MSSTRPHVAGDAAVEPGARIGDTTSVWGLAQVREGAVVGMQCIIGRGAYIGAGVVLGDRVKVQNFAQVYEPARIADGVFIGPMAVLTNDQYPRAITPDGGLATSADWEPVGVTIDEGASIGARAVCVAPLRVGRWAMVAAGATVTRDVPAFALVAGGPARFIGWVGKTGRRLEEIEGKRWRCPTTGEVYVERDGELSEEEA